jgi:uncharacterized protein YbbC (DUF1343 family)
MPGLVRSLPAILAVLLTLIGFSIIGCSSSGPSGNTTRSSPRSPKSQAEPPSRPTRPANASNASTPQRPDGPIMLGIDVLAAQNFAPIAGKRVGLFTHPAGVNRFGVHTTDILRRAANVKLVALFGPEHGVFGDYLFEKPVPDTIDKRTGLPAYSLYGVRKKPTAAQLKTIDVMVVDLQDIGVRSYTFATWMRYAMEACFEAGVEVVVLDRPNPLGGIKVDGPPLDPELKSDVGGFPVPYVHGLTIGELARWAASARGILNVSESVRQRGKLTVIPMQGWQRSMRWPETGLTFVPTSQNIPDFAACVGYAMTGLGCIIGDFSHGVGTQYPFRGIFYNGKPIDVLVRELQGLGLPGLGFRKVSVIKNNGQPAIGAYVEVTDWDDWRPTELSFHLMRLACRFTGKNVFAQAARTAKEREFKVHVGSAEIWNALARDGARADIEGFLAEWQRANQVYRQQTRKYWLYD